jgi:hypothetical protein
MGIAGPQLAEEHDRDRFGAAKRTQTVTIMKYHFRVLRFCHLRIP